MKCGAKRTHLKRRVQLVCLIREDTLTDSKARHIYNIGYCAIFFQWSLVLTDVKICNICTKWYALIQDEFHNLLMGEEWLIVSLCFRMCIMLKCPMHSISDRLKSVEFFILCLLHDTYYTSSLHCYIWTLRYASFLCIIRLLWKQTTFSYMDGISLCAATHPLRRPFTDSLYEWNNHSVHRTIAE